jgi:hypothetical protein
MPQVFKLNLPEGTKPKQEEMDEIAIELKQVEGVKFANPSTPTRGGEVEPLMFLIQTLPTILTTVNTALPMIQKMGGILHKKGLKGVTIEGPNGLKISLDKASPEDVQQLIDAMKGTKVKAKTT